MDTTTNPISDILSRLMFEKRIKTAELARRINLPQPTVHRIVKGTSPRPHHSSLLPLADFFGISLEQLKGLKPIPGLNSRNPDSSPPDLRELPLLNFDEVMGWYHNKLHENFSPSEKFFCDAPVSDRAYILKMNDASMSPQFPIGTLLIIDPSRLPKDRSFIIAILKNSPVAIFRQLLIDGPHYYIKPISPDFDHFRMTLLKEGDILCGTLVQIKINFNG